MVTTRSTREPNQTYDGETLDKEMIDSVDTNINMSVPWYLMASYAYYQEDSPILSDACFDRLAKTILNNFDKIEHEHKKFLNEDMLRAGTYIGEYPNKTMGGLSSLRYAYNLYKK